MLMHLALNDLFRAKWSKDIHAEWTRNVLRDRPDLSAKQLERTVSLMNLNVLDALVSGYESIIDTLDLDDRHVLAAAIVCHADAIITYNLKDFQTFFEWTVSAAHCF